MMIDLVRHIQAGTWKPSHVRGNLASDSAVLDPFGQAGPEAVAQKVLAEKAAIIAGTKVVWQGPITNQDGTSAASAGHTMYLQISVERRVGEECVGTVRSGRAWLNQKKKLHR